MIDQINILDCVDIINNSVVSYEGMRGYLDTGGLKSNKIVEIRDFDFNDKPSRANQNVEVGDIILARMKATTKVKVISQSESELMVSTGFIVLRPKRTIIDNNFLNHTLISPFFQRKKDKLCSGSTQKAINNGNFKKLKLPLPPLDQQKKIAVVLNAADAYRQKTKALITKYDELTQSLFLDMFGDPVTNPRGWDKRPMGELMTIVRGGSPRPIDKFLGGNYPWIKIGDATKGDDIYLNSTKQSIIEAGLSKTRLLPKGSLIFANCGVSLGFARIINIEGCIHDGWLAFSDLNTSLSKLFLLKALNNITRYFRETAPDGTQPNLNSGIMKSFEIILPPIELQNKFELTLLELTKQKNQAQANLAQAEDLFNSLLQKAFKGELTS